MASTKFCTHCGNPIPPNVAPTASLALVPWLILAALMLIGLGYFIGSSGVAQRSSTTVAVGAADEGPIVLAPDISSLSPEERVDRLFNRVMTLAEAGKMDSVRFFAPMALNALAALMPYDNHRRYDLGLIQLTVGNAASAGAQADSILASSRTHLLGLTLAMRVATAENRPADARRFAAALRAAAASERAKGLREYTEHARDIAEALETGVR